MGKNCMIYGPENFPNYQKVHKNKIYCKIIALEICTLENCTIMKAVVTEPGICAL